MSVFDILSPKQMKAIKNSNKTWNLWSGSVRSGKTYGSYFWWLLYVCRRAPVGDLLMVGKTQRTLLRNVIAPMIRLFGDDVMTYNQGSETGTIGGRIFYTVGANDERSQDKIRGATFAGVYGDEVTLWPESFFRMLQSRLSVTGAKAIITTNPDSPYHYIKRSLIDRQNESDLSIHCETFHLNDNPFLSEEFIRRISAEYQGLWYKRFILGEWCQAEGAIYDMFNDDIHVVNKDELFSDPVRRVFAMDYGTHNPTAGILLNMDSNGNLYASDEYYYDGRKSMKQKTDGEYARDLSEFFEKHGLRKGSTPLIIDPSAASFKVECRKAGFKVKDAENSVLDGIRRVGNLLSGGNLFISPRCKNLRKELVSYVWDSRSRADGKDVPLKENDHACDALRYGCMELTNNKPMRINASNLYR